MGYNDYMKKRQNEFRNDYYKLLMDSRMLSKKERLSRLHELREKYMDLIIFEQSNRKLKNGKSKRKVRRKVRFDRDLL